MFLICDKKKYILEKYNMVFQIEQITDNSYFDIKTLFLKIGYKHSLSYIKKKYNTCEFGLKNIGFIAKDKGIPAAYYGIFPIRMYYDSVDFLIAQSGDTMTAPSYQKKGLFTKLAKKTYEISEKRGIKLIFGFPNTNSYSGFKYKLEWKFSGYMQRFVIEGKTFFVCKLLRKLNILISLCDKIAKKRIAKYIINPENTDLLAFKFSNVKGQVKKDLIFFKYKLRQDNVFLIQINGFKILLKIDTFLYIGEVGEINKTQTKLLISTLKELSKRLGCAAVLFTISKNHWLFDMLKDEIEPEQSLPIGFYVIDKDLDINQIQFSNADFDTF